jgi:hypothetical protein
MTPHLIRFENGDEFDAMTRRGRRWHRFRAGARAGIKRRFRRRERRIFKTCKSDTVADSSPSANIF